MMEENVNGSMEIKSTNEEEVVLTNDWQDNAHHIEPAPETEQPLMKVCLKRTKDGLVRDDNEGKEISSIFDILEPGDNLNHQTVVEVNNGQATLDYFGRQSTISDDREIFSVLIKEEIKEWKRLIKEQEDITELFDHGEEESLVHLFRLLELFCMSTDVEGVDYITISDPIEPGTDTFMERILTMIFGTLRKPILNYYQDIKGKKVINYMYNYDKEEIEDMKKRIKDLGGELLYTVALYNDNNLEVEDKDIIILC